MTDRSRFLVISLTGKVMVMLTKTRRAAVKNHYLNIQISGQLLKMLPPML